MLDLSQLESDSVVIGYCHSEELDRLKITIKAFSRGYAKTPKEYLSGAKTVIVIGSSVEFSEDTYNRNIFSSGYPGYSEVFKISKQIASYLEKNKYKAKVAHALSQKNSAVLAGLGVWGKNSLVLSERFGTHLRLDTVVTDWIPNEYSKPILEDLCKNCNLCVEACPHECLEPYAVDAKKCFCKYIQRTELKLEIPMCSVCQKVCPYNKET